MTSKTAEPQQTGPQIRNKREYIGSLKGAIWKNDRCRATWLKTLPVVGTYRGKTVWNGDGEVFSIVGHLMAGRAYDWVLEQGPKGSQPRFVIVLELPPVKDATTAVHAAMLSRKNQPSGSCVHSATRSRPRGMR